MKIKIQKLLAIFTVVSVIGIVGCNKNIDKSSEIEQEKNIVEGNSSHSLITKISAGTDNGTGVFSENTVHYKLVGENYYIGPKDYLVISDDEIVIYDRGGEQVIFSNNGSDNNFYSVEGLGVEGLHYDGEDILLRCNDGHFYPISNDGKISTSPKANIKIQTIDVSALEEIVQGKNKYVSVLRVDEEGNFYTHEELFLYGYDVQYFEHRICKYDKYGGLIGCAIYYPDDMVAEPDKTVVVTENGSIYRMLCEKNEVKILKVTLGTEDTSSLRARTEALAESMNKLHSNYSRYEEMCDKYIMRGSMPQLLIDVLSCHGDFIDTDNNGKITNLIEYRGGYSPQYVWVLDMDRDGYNEVLTRINWDDNEFVVFRYKENRVYSYFIEADWYLNNDGLMRDLDGAYFVLEFTTSGYTKKILAYSDGDENSKTYYMGGKVVSRDTYVKLICPFEDEEEPYGREMSYGVTGDLFRLDVYMTYTGKFRELIYAKMYAEELERQGQKAVIDNAIYYSVSQEIIDELLYNNTLKIKNYIIADLDWDGNSEIVAYMDNEAEDVMVFHSEDGVVYSYCLPAGAINAVSLEGYTLGNAGGFEIGTYRLGFEKDTYSVWDICGTSGEAEYQTYYVDGQEVTKEEYEEFYKTIWGNGSLQKYETLVMLAGYVENIEINGE